MIELPASGLSIQRRFELQVSTGFPYWRGVEQVVESMLPTEISVFAPGECIATAWCEDDGAWDLGVGSEVVIARDWLPLACQWVRANVGGEWSKPGVVGEYKSNFLAAILGGQYGENEPMGVGAFHGEAVISQSLLGGDDDGRVMWVVAHELTHAALHLPVLVAAYLDWERFRESFEDGTNAPDVLSSWVDGLNYFVEAYGSDQERAEVARFWPEELIAQWWKTWRED